MSVPHADPEALIRAGERLGPGHYALDEGQWEAMVDAFAAVQAERDAGPGRLWFIGHWLSADRAFALFHEGRQTLLVSTLVQDGRYLALSRGLPAAEWAERAAQDLMDARPMFARDVAPLLDAGGWSQTAPLSSRPGPGSPASAPAPSHEPLGMIACGSGCALLVPVEEGGRLEFRPGLAHHGLAARLTGLAPEAALRLVGRVTAAGFVAHPLAFCRAVESALGIAVPATGGDGRIVLSEIERISIHLADLGATAAAGGAGLLATHAALAREALAALCVEHGATMRLTDCIQPDGISDAIAVAPLALAAAALVETRLETLRALHRLFAPCVRGVGILARAPVERFAIGGLVARAGGRSFDLRQQEEDHRHMPGRAGSLVDGDARARGALRLREIGDAARRIARVAEKFGAGPEISVPRTATGEGIGAAEGPRGDVWYWVRLKEGKIDAIWLRDPTFSLGPALGAVLRRESEAAWPLVLASLGVSAAGMAL